MFIFISIVITQLLINYNCIIKYMPGISPSTRDTETFGTFPTVEELKEI